jgi:hypothetical protein
VIRALAPHERRLNVFLRWAARLDRPGYPLHVRVLDVLGGWYARFVPPLVIVGFYAFAAVVVALAVVFVCSLSSCAAVAAETYEADLKKCANETPVGDEAGYEACKRAKKIKWNVDAGAE